DEHSSAIDEAPLPTDPDGRPIAGVAPSDFIEPRRDGHRAGFVNKAPKAFRLHGSQPSTEPISVFELWLDDERARRVDKAPPTASRDRGQIALEGLDAVELRLGNEGTCLVDEPPFGARSHGGQSLREAP